MLWKVQIHGKITSQMVRLQYIGTSVMHRKKIKYV